MSKLRCGAYGAFVTLSDFTTARADIEAGDGEVVFMACGVLLCGVRSELLEQLCQVVNAQCPKHAYPPSTSIRPEKGQVVGVGLLQ